MSDHVKLTWTENRHQNECGASLIEDMNNFMHAQYFSEVQDLMISHAGKCIAVKPNKELPINTSIRYTIKNVIY